MKHLYFIFAVLALPVAAFAEVSDTMIHQTSLKQSPERAPKDETCHNPSLSCAQTQPEPQQMQRKQRFEENKNSIANRNGQVASRKRPRAEPEIK